MSEAEKILLTEVRSIKKLLVSDKGPYCDTQEAMLLIGVNNHRYLAQLHQRGFIKRYQRANGFKYKKSELKQIADKLDAKEIVLEPIIKSKKNGL